MAEYLTTREIANYLKLNEKKVYDLVSKGLAHLACCHLDDATIEGLLKDLDGYCLVHLFGREQGMI